MSRKPLATRRTSASDWREMDRDVGHLLRGLCSGWAGISPVHELTLFRVIADGLNPSRSCRSRANLSRSRTTASRAQLAVGVGQFLDHLAEPRQRVDHQTGQQRGLTADRSSRRSLAGQERRQNMLRPVAANSVQAARDGSRSSSEPAKNPPSAPPLRVVHEQRQGR